MSAFTELRAGTPATEFSALLTRTVLAVAITRNFPPPDGGNWTSAKATETANEFLSQPRTQGIIDKLALQCADDDALAAMLQAIIRNFLRDRGRQTEVGRLVVRLRRAIRESDDFTLLPDGRCALSAGPVTASTTPPADLVAAAGNVPIAYVSWSPTARRNEPFADKTSIEALIRAVLGAAQGSLRPADLAIAIAPRLQVTTSPSYAELDPGDYPEPSSGDLDEVGTDLANREHARELFDLLTDREKIALGRPDLTTRELGKAIGRGHSQAGIVRQRAVGMLSAALAQDEDGPATAELVIEYAKLWCERRTMSNDSTL